MSNVLAILAFFFLIFTSVFSQQPSWTYVGAPEGGIAQCFAGNSKGTAFMASSCGLYKTAENGRWRLIDDENEFSQVLVTEKDEIITVGNNQRINVKISRDDGVSWSNILLPTYKQVNDSESISFDVYSAQIAEKNSILYAFIRLDNSDIDGNQILCYSTNTGKKWYPIDLPEDTTMINNFDVNDNGNIAILSTIGDTTQIFVSSDKGKTWNKHKFEDQIYPTCLKYINDSTLVVIASFNFIWSNDNGNSWHKRELRGENNDEYMIAGYAFKDGANIYLTSNKGILISSDYFETWKDFTVGIEGSIDGDETIKQSLQFFIKNKHEYYVSMYPSNIMRSTDSGESWSVFNAGFQCLQPASCAAFDKDGNIYLGSYGIYSSSDGGSHWRSITKDVSHIETMAVSPEGDIYAGSTNKIIVSKDKGINWEQCDFMNIWDTVSSTVYMDVKKIIAAGNSKIYALVNGYADKSIASIIVSDNRGKTWKEVKYSSLIAAFDINSEEFIFALDNSGQIIRTTDDGITWEKFNKFNLLNDNDICMIFNPKNKYGLFTNYYEVGLTSDDGLSWTLAQYTGSYKTAFSRILFEGYAIDSIGGLWSIAYENPIRTYNNGETIEEFTNGLNKDFSFKRLLGTDSKGYVYLTNSKGLIYKINANMTSIKENNNQSDLRVNLYPNPARSNVFLDFRIEENSTVSISVLNQLGNEVFVISKNELLQPGNCNKEIDVSGIPDGIYYLKLIIQNHTEIKKLVVIK